MSQPETRLQRKIQLALKSRGAFVFKVHGSEFMMSGLPDLIGSYRGQFFAIEVKMPGNGPSKIQELRHKQIEASEGHVCVAYNVPEALELLDAIDVMLEGERSS